MSDSPRSLRVVIPEGVEFGALRLRREASGSVSFDVAIIARVARASGLDPALWLETHEDNVAGLIVAWYAEHLRRGGEPDAVAEQLGAEVRAEDGYEGVE